MGRAPTRGLAWTLRADVQDCFPSIDRDLALDALRRLGADAPTRELVRRLLEAGAEEDGSLLSPEPGLPQGGALSPLLCNLVLHGFDRDLAAAGGELTRYADDLVVAVRDRRAAERAHEAAHASLAAHGLRLNADKSGVVSFAQGFRFLGTLFVGSLVLPTLRHVDAKGRATYRSGYDGACAPALHDGPRREPPPSDRAVGRRMARAFRDQREGRRSTALGRALVRAWREDAAEEEDEAPSGSVVWV